MKVSERDIRPEGIDTWTIGDLVEIQDNYMRSGTPAVIDGDRRVFLPPGFRAHDDAPEERICLNLPIQKARRG